MKRSNRLVLLVGVFLAVIAFVGVLLLSQNQQPPPPEEVKKTVVIAAPCRRAAPDRAREPG